MIRGINSGAGYLIGQEMEREKQESPFELIDFNEDGVLEMSELKSFAAQMPEGAGPSLSAYDLIAELDTDGDALLTREEFDAGRSGGLPPGALMGLFGEIDADKNGELDESEVSAFVKAMEEMDGAGEIAPDIIAELDADGDGVLSLEELEAGRPDGPPPHMAGAMSGGQQAGANEAAQVQEEASPEELEPLDANGDGFVDAKEAAAGLNLRAWMQVNQKSAIYGSYGKGRNSVNLSA
ncbi:Ca2+-binding protein, EF-hand superfamily [Desulfatibacillum alkenivorans DSM 16219]|jgi:Ca2+-binding EF-hand superfamily protein|uniref:Ca2+-binding protein, EF-hand superfamily n=1 Tax=Desulfatibacillum alkenivorans DSM 16219 TaxID=1121393 RepID=A0A1M6IIK1_9BACT|nr:EF-hand domain-containing protein [Desulfatibacillum alkenivorans]SHJ34301.1 Ca2+-binding protein, EF-hand superfamily [Desulfatibacillum alkenivorans DSM 16219]